MGQRKTRKSVFRNVTRTSIEPLRAQSQSGRLLELILHFLLIPDIVPCVWRKICKPHTRTHSQLFPTPSNKSPRSSMTYPPTAQQDRRPTISHDLYSVLTGSGMILTNHLRLRRYRRHRHRRGRQHAPPDVSLPGSTSLHRNAPSAKHTYSAVRKPSTRKNTKLTN